MDLENLKRFKNKIKLRNNLNIKKIENKNREKRNIDANQVIYNNIEKKLDRNISEMKTVESNAKKILPQVFEKEQEIKEEEFFENAFTNASRIYSGYIGHLRIAFVCTPFTGRFESSVGSYIKTGSEP